MPKKQTPQTDATEVLDDQVLTGSTVVEPDAPQDPSPPPAGARCPNCACGHSDWVDKRKGMGSREIHTHKCRHCGRIFKTYVKPKETTAPPPAPKGIQCPKCGETKSEVINSRPGMGNRIARRRRCTACKHRFSTWERTQAQLIDESAH